MSKISRLLYRMFRMKPWAIIDWWLFTSATLIGCSIASLVFVLSVKR